MVNYPPLQSGGGGVAPIIYPQAELQRRTQPWRYDCTVRTHVDCLVEVRFETIINALTIGSGDFHAVNTNVEHLIGVDASGGRAAHHHKK